MLKNTSLSKTKYDIISVSHYFPPRIGGLENMAYNLLDGLSERGISSIALFGSDTTCPQTTKNFDTMCFKVPSIFNNTYPIFGLKFIRKCSWLIRHNPNAKVLIHSRHLTSSILTSLVCRFHKHPYTLIEHNAGPVYFSSKLISRMSNWVDRNFFAGVLENAEDIIAVSETGKKWISKNFGISKYRISVIYNAFPPTEKKIDLHAKKNIAVFASKWIRVKDPSTTLKAYVNIAGKHPNWTFMMIGEGKDLSYTQADLPDNVVIQDSLLAQSSLFELLAESKIYINSSLSEGLSLGVLEAVAHGNIPVLSSAESNKEVARHLDTHTFQFKTRNHKDLEKKIEAAITASHDTQMVSNLRKSVNKYFSIDTLVNTYHIRLLPRHAIGPTLLSIVIPVYNEEALVKTLLKKVSAIRLPRGIGKEIIIVNDGSTDGSASAVNDFLQEQKADSNTTYIFMENTRNKGKSQTVKKGILASSGDLVVTQDADLEYTPSELKNFVERFVKNRHLDVIYGNRFNENNTFSNGIHSWGNKFVTRMSNMFTRVRGFAPKDMETCYKMVRGDIMRTLFETIESETSFGLEPELTAKLARYRFPNGKKLQFDEINISYKPRDVSAGKKMRWFKDGFEALLEILYFNVAPFTVTESIQNITTRRRL